MSPSRRTQFVPTRPRAEVWTAVAVAVGIVVATALLIWLMRPGKAGVPGGGGILNRQPRMTILVLLALALLAGVITYVTRRHKPPRFGLRGSIAIGTVVVLVVAVVAGIFWPGGSVKHYPKAAPSSPSVSVPASVPSSTPASSTPATTAKTGSSVTGSTTPSSDTSTPTTPTTKAG